MRTIGFDVHKRFAEVAVHEHGQVQHLGRVSTAPEALQAFAESLGPEDHIVIESTAFSWAVVELLSSHAGKVTVSNPLQTRAIASAKVKTDKVDARVLAQLGAAEFIPAVWRPDRETRALRRRLAHRARLVRQRTRFRNEVHAILQRNLVQVPETDVFGKRGRKLLGELSLPTHECDQLESALRLHDALEQEITAAEGALSAEALASEKVRRLMTIPGVGPITALSLLAVIGDVDRFPSSRHLTSYLGLDPRVRQSGERPARTGHISRQGHAHTRGLLVEAAHSGVRAPGPLRAFYQRVKGRRGKQIALVAAARKLAVISWQLLTKEEDYRYQAPTLTQRKLRELQRKAGDQGPKIRSGWARGRRVLERGLLEQAERNYIAEVSLRSEGAGAASGDATVKGRFAANDARRACGPQVPALLDRGRPRQLAS